jgi:guanosine-3',5'-bis(diphosphate) 3'-pyrophosphohydrolase
MYREESGLDLQQLSLLVKAMAFAAQKHKDQRRKDEAGSPYINHPVQLVDVLVHEGGVTDLSTIVAAMLHDTVEDTDATADEIEAVFGAEIRLIVEEVTDDKSLGRQACKQHQIDKAPSLSYEARAVKLADKICNLRDIASNPPAGWPLDRRQAYFDWSKRVIDGLRGTHPTLEALFDETYRLRPGGD